MEKEHHNKIRLLGVYSALLVHKAFWALWTKEEDLRREIKIISEVKDGIKMIGTSLGFDIFPEDLIVKDSFDTNRPITSLVFCCLDNDNDPIRSYLEKVYGSSSKFVYTFSQMTAVARGVINFLSLATIQNTISHKRDELIESEAHLGKAFIQQYALFLHNNKSAISKLFPEIAEGFNDLQRTIQDSQLTKKACAILLEKFDPVFNSLYPEYNELLERLKRAEQLTEELKRCKSGQANWRKYEKLGIRILRFLFMPPFKRVLEQSRTEAGDTRRDAVLPNNQYGGFWQLIRDEFDSRHIVCEFKNYFTKTSKVQLNQLRLYLSKPTVGRFGLLFIRHTPSPQLLVARCRAYEESHILILILSDELVKQMLKMRAFTGRPENILEDLKIQFELSY